MELFRDSFVFLLLLMVTLLLLALRGQAVPSARAFILLALPVPLYLLGFAWQPALILLDLYNLILLTVLMADRFLVSAEPGQLELSRSFNPLFSIRQDNPVTLTLVNNSGTPLELEVTDRIPPEAFSRTSLPSMRVPLGAYGRQTVDYILNPLRRGQFAFGKIHVRYRSGWGLLWIHKRGARQEPFKVYPDLKRLQQMRVKYSRSVSAGEMRRRRIGLQGTQFEGLRGYAAGDDIRKMDWKASARLDVPIIRTFTSEVDQPILIMLDAGRKMETRVQELTKFDWALNAALAFASVSLEHGDQVGIGVFANEIISYTPVSAGKKHLKQILEQLYDIQPRNREPDYDKALLQFCRQLKRRTLIVIFTDLIDPLSSRALIRALKASSANHLVIVVTLSDLPLLQLAAQYPQTLEETYEKSVAMDLLNVRRQALAELTKGMGAIVLDAPPESMDESLINEYLAIKLKNQL